MGMTKMGEKEMTGIKGEQQGKVNPKHGDIDIRKLSLAIRKPTVKGQVLLSLRVEVSNQAAQDARHLTLQAQVEDPGGKVLTPEQAQSTVQISCLRRGVDCDVFLHHLIDWPHLWAPQAPNLYQVRLVISDEQGQVLDTHRQAFGIQQFPSGHYGIKQVGQNIALAPSDEETNAFWIANLFDYISLERFEPHWELQEDGVTIAEGTMERLPVPPGQSVKMSLPINNIDYRRTAHYEWILSLRPITKSLWSPAEQSVTTGRVRLQ